MKITIALHEEETPTVGPIFLVPLQLAHLAASFVPLAAGTSETDSLLETK